MRRNTVARSHSTTTVPVTNNGNQECAREGIGSAGHTERRLNDQVSRRGTSLRGEGHGCLSANNKDRLKINGYLE